MANLGSRLKLTDRHRLQLSTVKNMIKVVEMDVNQIDKGDFSFMTHPLIARSHENAYKLINKFDKWDAFDWENPLENPELKPIIKSMKESDRHTEITMKNVIANMKIIRQHGFTGFTTHYQNKIWKEMQEFLPRL